MSTNPEQRATRVDRKLDPSDQDRRTLAQIQVDPATQEDDAFDYSKVVVRKPWGYEYLIFQNELAAVWILHIKQGYQTSLHCHPRKKTSITILSGEAICSTLEDEYIRHAGDVLLVGEGVFHRTTAISEEGAFLMEIESPVNKRDLVRYRDDYGREKLGYETVDQMSFNLQNYNYTSLIDPEVYYNVKKRFGRCSIQLAKFRNAEEMKNALDTQPWDVLSVLKGTIRGKGNGFRLRAGDVLSPENLNADPVELEGELDGLIVSHADTNIRLSDYLVSHLKKRGLKDYFYVPGSSNAHLLDAIGRDTDVQSVCLQTEHAATLAAEAYAKVTGLPAAVVVASGSSASGALTGVADAWIDSTPMLVLSGQSRSSDLGAPGEDGLRQLANKELDIASMALPIVKYAAVVRDALAVKAEVDHAMDVAMQSRMGPAWIDIPIDILGRNVDERKMTSAPQPEGSSAATADSGRDLLRLLERASRPVILAGHGIRAAGAREPFIELAERLRIPVLTSRRGADLLPQDSGVFFGRPGTYGQRAANFVIQNCDLLIAIGARLSMPLIGRNYKAFARGATKVIVDVDPGELSKSTVPADLAIRADAREFINMMLAATAGESIRRPEWLERCAHWQTKYPPAREYSRADGNGVNPYFFVETLSEILGDDDIVVVDGGHSLDYVMQTFKVKSNQRIISSPGLEHEGFALPGAIGAYVAARGQRRIVCLCEKKGLQSNLSELETIVNHRMPVKIFVLNGKGNFTVQRIQAAYFGGRYVGSSTDGVLGTLNIAKLGEAYGLEPLTIAGRADAGERISAVLEAQGPVLCEVRLPDDHEIIPRVTLTVTQDGKWSARPIEDMYPLLSREELRAEMIVAPLDEE